MENKLFQVCPTRPVPKTIFSIVSQLPNSPDPPIFPLLVRVDELWKCGNEKKASHFVHTHNNVLFFNMRKNDQNHLSNVLNLVSPPISMVNKIKKLFNPHFVIFSMVRWMTGAIINVWYAHLVAKNTQIKSWILQCIWVSQLSSHKTLSFYQWISIVLSKMKEKH